MVSVMVMMMVRHIEVCFVSCKLVAEDNEFVFYFDEVYRIFCHDCHNSSFANKDEKENT